MGRHEIDEPESREGMYLRKAALPAGKDEIDEPESGYLKALPHGNSVPVDIIKSRQTLSK
ncbi:hypothetical protein HBI56_133590 [Parastagonospora nodorum]|nr:hypothetical protein HBH53_047340 [Parastagonospora nodorum]KAH3979626.1 hypothetical protein HBH51_058340 [Parastagonospora nodorum]KAH4039659.1 hypothetical protein HBI09_034810 [Parastagonospora nodorum]KAH4201296.1 hypothetical protein HBH42_027670 [Parastagonospora nodorum]KAH4234132.1 hypothetical protein HBI05_154110 [Parastagonospora nodorum]